MDSALHPLAGIHKRVQLLHDRIRNFVITDSRGPPGSCSILLGVNGPPPPQSLDPEVPTDCLGDLKGLLKPHPLSLGGFI